MRGRRDFYTQVLSFSKYVRDVFFFFFSIFLFLHELRKAELFSFESMNISSAQKCQFWVHKYLNNFVKKINFI